MSTHGPTQAGTAHGTPTPDRPATGQPGSGPAVGVAAPSGAVLNPTGAHVGLSPVAKAMRQPPPAPARPGPSSQRLLGLCAAAAVIGFAGILVGMRGWLGLVMHQTAGWYLPAIAVIGILGVITAAGGFLTVHRRRTPWVMLGLSASTVIIGMIVTAVGVN